MAINERDLVRKSDPVYDEDLVNKRYVDSSPTVERKLKALIQKEILESNVGLEHLIIKKVGNQVWIRSKV